MKLLNILTMRGENNMSNDLFDKNGVWQGSQSEFLEYAKDVINDATKNQGHGVIDAINEDILKCIDQKKLEDIVSEHCKTLEENIKKGVNDDINEFHLLGMLIKTN